MMSFAFSCVSGSANRTFRFFASSSTPRDCTPSLARASSTRVTSDVSSGVPAWTGDTCTAGTSPKMLGEAYRKPMPSTKAMRRYFQSG